MGAAEQLYEREPQLVGRRYGLWVVVAPAGYYSSNQRAYVAACVRCGERVRAQVYELRRLHDHDCDPFAPEQDPAETAAPLVDGWTPWERDGNCRAAVRFRPGGVTQAVVAGLMGLTEDRVQQIEAAALAKLRQEHGEDLAPLLARLLAELQG
jgi:hypothetical protein